MFVQINNLINERGQADYKGFDISKNVPGSQLYALENGDNYCVLETTEEVAPDHPDVTILSAEEYEQKRDEIISKTPPVTDPLEDLRQENAELKQAIAELTMMIAAAPQV
jgi:hypothetical protein